VKLTTPTTPGPDLAPDDARETGEEAWVRCAACGARLAPSRARIDVNGAHEHSFMNPSGLRFEVVCFAVAPGCMPDGERSTVWTWFPGRAWQVALCKGCGSHVGWSFHADDVAPFHGLVRARIVG
jgi:hypothetical protein